MKRPLSIREMQQAEEVRPGYIRIINTSRQLVTVHLKPPPKTDFFFGAQDVRLAPNKDHTFARDRVWMEQIEVLQKRGMLKIIYDSETNKKS